MIISPDKKGTIDPTVFDIIKHIKSEIPIVPITRLVGFEFNPNLLNLDKYILCNYSEYDWDFDWDRGTPIFGKNIEQFRDKFVGDEWSKFIDFVNKKPPILTLQRELLATDVTDNVKPIEFPNWHKPFPIQSKSEYESRPISVFNFWGYSHEDRVQLHGDIWKESSRIGYSVCDNIYHFEKFMQEKHDKRWVSLYMPHYSRVEIATILALNGMSKLSVSMPGAGIKCFRTTGESPVNSLMVMPKNKLAWAYEWIDGFNCFLASSNMIDELPLILKDDKLYEIYCESVNTANKYYYPDYVNNYILPLINKY